MGNQSQYGTPVYIDGKEAAFWCETLEGHKCTPENCSGCPAREHRVTLPFELQLELDRSALEYARAGARLRAASKAADEWREAYWLERYGVKKGDKLLVTQAMVVFFENTLFVPPMYQNCETGDVLEVLGFSVYGRATLWHPKASKVWGSAVNVPGEIVKGARQAYLAVYGSEEKE